MYPKNRAGHSSPLLTIAIPNRNQLNGLVLQEETLRKVSRHGDIQILVSDNHSNDNSAEYLQANWSDFSSVSLLRENVGIAGNLRNLTLSASGEWIWFIGSGDLPDLSSIQPLLELLSIADSNVSIVLFDGAYECIQPFLGGSLYRRRSLISVIESDTDEVWPHVSWSIEIELSNPMADVIKSPLIEIEPWTSSDDWHSRKAMFPYAESLNKVLYLGFQRNPKSQRLRNDLMESEKTLLTWYIQDRLSGKITGLNRNLVSSIRNSGKASEYLFLKLLAISISLVPYGILRRLKLILNSLQR
ncbi:MAG: hypothetical protein RL460_44 [Actinomycetota bacterium]|jgi:glycosyltransferase involved in cell wall biosynthesis